MRAIATGATYRITRQDRGRKLSVEVTVARTGYAPLTSVSKAKKVSRR